MNQDCWQQVKKIFDAALRLAPSVRALWQRKLEKLNEKTRRGEYVPAMNYALAAPRRIARMKLSDEF